MASAAEAGGKYLAFLGRFSARVFLHARESRVSPARQRRPERELAGSYAYYVNASTSGWFTMLRLYTLGRGDITEVGIFRFAEYLDIFFGIYLQDITTGISPECLSRYSQDISKTFLPVEILPRNFGIFSEFPEIT